MDAITEHMVEKHKVGIIVTLFALTVKGMADLLYYCAGFDERREFYTAELVRH